MKKKFFIMVSIVLVIAMLGIGLAGCATKSKEDEATENKPAPKESATQKAEEPEVITLKMGHCHPTDSQFNAGSEKFAELLSQKTDGKVKLEVYHSSQLGDEGELSEGIRIGTVDLALVASGSVTKYQPRYSLFDLPYLFRDYDHVDKVLKGEPGKMLADESEKVAGIKVLSYWESGFRHYVNNKKPVKSPKDLEGLKIRTPEWPVLIATTKALGANVVPMPFSELYMACQQGVVDGQEGPVFAIKSAKMYEVQKYMVLDGHTYTAMLVVMNPDKFNSLTPEIQKALVEAVDEAGDYERKLIRDKEKEEIQFLETTGNLTIQKNPDKEEWRNASSSVYDKFSEQFGKDLIQEIIDTK